MATLTNQQINLTYPSLIKFDDNLGVQPTTAKQLTDGTGGSLPISVSQVETVFQTGTIVDFTGTTVNGLPISPSGLTAGTGPDSMQSASFLTPNPANASGTSSIALGNAVTASQTSSIAIGDSGQSSGSDGSIKIGMGNNATNDGLISIGNGGTVSGNLSIGMGYNAQVTGSASICIQTTGFDFGSISGAGVLHLVPGGYSTNVSAANAIVLGSCQDNRARVTADNGIAIGRNTFTNGNNAVALGTDASATADNSVAIGAGIQATRNSFVSVNALEIKNSTDALIMYSPNQTAYRVTVSDAGVLVVTAV